VAGAQNGGDGRPLLHGDEDVVAAGQAERVGVGAQRPQGGDAVELLHHVPALEILYDGVAQPGPGRCLGDGELGALAGQPERTSPGGALGRWPLPSALIRGRLPVLPTMATRWVGSSGE
jgi:hypothetical protein